jgi:hypothetical protein
MKDGMKTMETKLEEESEGDAEDENGEEASETQWNGRRSTSTSTVMNDL